MRKIYENNYFNNTKKPEKAFRQFEPKPFLIVIEGGLGEIKRTASANKSEKRLGKKIINYIIPKD